MKPTYFDFTVNDLDQAKLFFEHVFDWRFEKFPGMPYEYYRIQAGAESELGIHGGIGAIADTPTAEGRPLTQVTIPVPSVDDYIARVEEAGGKVVESKMPIPGIGWFAACAEPGGLLFGIMEADPEAK